MKQEFQCPICKKQIDLRSEEYRLENKASHMKLHKRIAVADKKIHRKEKELQRMKEEFNSMLNWL